MGSFRKKQFAWLAVIEGLIALLCLNFALKNPTVFEERLKAVCFLVLSILLIILSGVAYWMVFVRKASLHKLVLLFGFAFGILSCTIHTPGSIPDEPAHASNVYLWSNRLLLLPEKEAQDQTNPVYRNVESFVRRADKENELLYQKCETSIESYQQILQFTKWIYTGDEKGLVSTILLNTHVTPIAYLPAILGFMIARLMSLGYYPMLMLGRFCMLTFYVLAVSWAIKKMPVGKMMLFLTALLPMSLHLAASLSYDAVILALSMMTFSYILYLAYGEIKIIGWKEKLTMLALCVLLAACKVGVYLPIVLLLLLIPHDKLGGKYRFFRFCIIMVLAGVASCVLMNLSALSIGVKNTLLTSVEGNGIISSNWALRHPAAVLQMMLSTVCDNGLNWLRSAIGCSLSWFSIQISRWVIIGFELCLLSTIFHDNDAKIITLAPMQRLLLFVPVILCVFLFLLGMLVWWTPEGSNTISGVQGRYFIPMIPLVLFALPQISIRLYLKRGEIQLPLHRSSQYVTMACVILNCASFLVQAVIILLR